LEGDGVVFGVRPFPQRHSAGANYGGENRESAGTVPSALKPLNAATSSSETSPADFVWFRESIAPLSPGVSAVAPVISRVRLHHHPARRAESPSTPGRLLQPES